MIYFHIAKANITVSISSLSLTNFRNHAEFQIQGEKKFIVISGNNGVGKTNILEAVSLLSPGRGLRNIKFNEIPNKAANSNDWSIFTELQESHGAHKIGTGFISNSAKRLFKINGEALQRQQDILEFIRVIWLTPQMDGLFLETPSSRRKFIDRISFNFFPEHASNVMHYQYAMRSRNKLLTDGVMDNIWLTNLEATMVEYGIKISELRTKSIELLSQGIQRIESGFLRPNLNLTPTFDNSSSPEEYKDQLRQNRIKDTKRRGCSIGPHTSDLIATHSEKLMDSSICSTGEQKAMLISLLLAQIWALNEFQNISPIVLLDEIFAHLDDTKKTQLIKEFKNLKAQFWITTTESSKIPIVKGQTRSIFI